MMHRQIIFKLATEGMEGRPKILLEVSDIMSVNVTRGCTGCTMLLTRSYGRVASLYTEVAQL